MFQPLFALAMVLAVASAAMPQDVSHSCIVIQDLAANEPRLVRGDRCSTALSPASTFKIPHALVALETGVVTVDSVEKWDGRKYERQAKWNLDHTVISALRPSVLWFYQRIAPRIGAPRMSEWLRNFDYGNRTVSGPITQYWVNGRLQISPPQQVSFLMKFFRGTLPVQQRSVDAVREGLRQQPGTVENALGVHQLEGDWRRATLYSKTGAANTESYNVSWLVGLLQTGGRDYVFAAAVWKSGAAVDSLEAARLAAATFVGEGLLPAAQ